jgi:hypothetical protein
MGDKDILRGLLQAYFGGDLLARRALLDYLEETGDPRGEAVRAEAIDWEAVARSAARAADQADEEARFRFYVDCARFNAGAAPEVVQAVRAARRRWLQGLFPEIELPAGT